jgi:hypothetical protein
MGSILRYLLILTSLISLSLYFLLNYIIDKIITNDMFDINKSDVAISNSFLLAEVNCKNLRLYFQSGKVLYTIDIDNLKFIIDPITNNLKVMINNDVKISSSTSSVDQDFNINVSNFILNADISFGVYKKLYEYYVNKDRHVFIFDMFKSISIDSDNIKILHGETFDAKINAKYSIQKEYLSNLLLNVKLNNKNINGNLFFTYNKNEIFNKSILNQILFFEQLFITEFTFKDRNNYLKLKGSVQDASKRYFDISISSNNILYILNSSIPDLIRETHLELVASEITGINKSINFLSILFRNNIFNAENIRIVNNKNGMKILK